MSKGVNKISFWSIVKRLSAIFSWVLVIGGLIINLFQNEINLATGATDTSMISAFAILTGLSCYLFYVSKDKMSYKINKISKKIIKGICGFLAIILAIGASILAFLCIISDGTIETTNIFSYALRLCWMFTGICCWVIYILIEKNYWDWLYPYVAILAMVVSYVIACLISGIRTLALNVLGSYTLSDIITAGIIIAIIVWVIKNRSNGDEGWTDSNDDEIESKPKWTGSREDLEELTKGINEYLSRVFLSNQNDAKDVEKWVTPKVHVSSEQITLTGGCRYIWLNSSKYTKEEIEEMQEELKYEEAEIMPSFILSLIDTVKEFRGCNSLKVSITDFKIIVTVV